MSDLRKQLNEDLNVATWEMLEPHLKRGALVEVSKTLDLVDVGMAIAEDNATLVKKWMDVGLLVNVEKEKEGQFKFLILSPYVLIQELSETN